MTDRTVTNAGELARRGFSDTERAVLALETLLDAHPNTPELLELLADTANQDQALVYLAELQRLAPTLLDEVCADLGWLNRLVQVLGASAALAQGLKTFPDDARVLVSDSVGCVDAVSEWGLGLQGLGSVDDARVLVSDSVVSADAVSGVDRGLREAVSSDGPQVLTPAPVVSETGLDSSPLKQRVLAVLTAANPADELRRANRRELLRIAGRDLSASDPFAVVDTIAAELAELADAVMETAYRIACNRVPGATQVRFAVIGLGKCGAQELNYLSDIDVLYVAEPINQTISTDAALLIGERVARVIAQVCATPTAAGSIWQVDAGLRPEGNAGPLVRTLESMRVYYTKWASNWEFQALLKARPMAGDIALGQQFVQLVLPLVWKAGERSDFVAESQAMRARVISLLPVAETDRELKLSAGGLRDVEFSVQLLQLVHGRADERLRLAATLPALAALVAHGYIGRDDGARLAQAYRFLRVVEHRAQLAQLRRTHLMPANDAERAHIAKSLGLISGDELWQRWRSTAAQVRALQQRVFYSPILEAVSQVRSEELRLSSDAAAARLRSLGFADTAAALRHIAALTAGVNRSAQIQRQLLPAMLGWLALGPNPDAGLLAFRQLSEDAGRSEWYLRTLRDTGVVAERLAKLLASSRYAVPLLRRDPAVLQLFTDDDELAPRSRADLLEAMGRIVERHDSAANAIEAVRALRRRELFRIAMGDVCSVVEIAQVGAGLSDLATATVDAALRIAATETPNTPPIGVIALGSWGGGELGYSSDADCMFVVPDGVTDAELSAASTTIARMRELLGLPGPDPALQIDADLRPEGKDGALVRTLTGYRSYYERWSLTWESQALLRATAAAGDLALAAQLITVIDQLRWPVAGLDAAEVLAIQKLKMRVDRERGGTNRERNLKLGPGGLADVEWTVQLAQLLYAHKFPELRVTSTRSALAALGDAGLFTRAECNTLDAAWVLASRMRNAIMLVRARTSDQLPTDAREIAAVAMLLGYGKAEASRLLDDWARASRRVVAVVGHRFWGS
ncbi:MAG: bifunctional [glutamine synthetase] adenylyltransferase/[glutamine synthetase]-adenylyl-L-tyrosine phosphorylase [Propionibacteriaceae bacterium]|jgi:glutamate-ammonia-ligase adenylyltransferase|nr:bifunctional [glutamine synthetase] adenylyltransferase/[glutamine synthetase]-adenylyl-L-tyrosine phosphorylase [Propionibacteriaceae bacterium]